MFSSYSLSGAVAKDPASLAPGFRGVTRGRYNHWADIAFPAQKVILYESVAYCLPTAEQRDYARRYGRTEYWPSSVLAGDGSVIRRAMVGSRDFFNPFAYDQYNTVNGLRGRDW